MVYKNGPRYRVRPVEDIKQDIIEAERLYGPNVYTIFLPAGNTIAMPTKGLAEVCNFAHIIFPQLERITVYGSSQFIHKKGPDKLKQLAEAGLGRVHVGLESGDDVILKYICKGTHSSEQIEAGRWLIEAGIELSLYVILGIGGRERTLEHAQETARVINEISPHFVRLRTFVPKINTPILNDVLSGHFKMLTPHRVLRETRALVEGLTVKTFLASDHYTNYINLHGRLPEDRRRLLKEIDNALEMDESDFRSFFIGTE
jgi:radical SAM superfamily enzyme YgiQ (UPF0313 family)